MVMYILYTVLYCMYLPYTLHLLRPWACELNTHSHKSYTVYTVKMKKREVVVSLQPFTLYFSMKIIAVLLIILVYSHTSAITGGNGVCGSKRAPGLKKAEDDYKTAKQLYYEALQLVNAAEKADEAAQLEWELQIEQDIEESRNEIDTTISSG